MTKLIPLLMDDLVPNLSNAAVYLSGGIDSTIVLYHCLKKIPNVTAYTAAFGVSTDEVYKAKRVAEFFHVTHRTVLIDNFIETLPEIMKLFDRPRYNVWPWWLAREAKQYLHAFIGEGSDELFGYPDRGYLQGWAGQLIYIRPTWDAVNTHFGITLHAPFTDLHNKLLDDYGPVGVVAMCYRPPMKMILREAYRDILPEWMLGQPASPPAMTNYTALGKKWGLEGNVKEQLQLLATKAWLEVHDGRS